MKALFRKQVTEEITRLADEDDYTGDKAHLVYMQTALSNVVEAVGENAEKQKAVKKKLIEWNKAPPRDVQIM